MPYIKPERRAALDTIINGIVTRLRGLDTGDEYSEQLIEGPFRGDVNYVITRIVLECLNKDSYHSLSDCVSVLRDSADEIARRLLGPYEDTAIDKNGDMECFQKDYALQTSAQRQKELIHQWCKAPKVTVDGREVAVQGPAPFIHFHQAAGDRDATPTFDAMHDEWCQDKVDARNLTIQDAAQEVADKVERPNDEEITEAMDRR
jgi:hypothetical protein